MHENAWRQWRAALSGDRMHHAWLLSGMQGLGKSAFALSAAQERVAIGAAEGSSPGTGDHPDIHILTHAPKDEKEEKKRAEGKPYDVKRNISVSQIRSIQRILTTRPTLGEHRVIIINPADDLERGASNALLKSLEEPPSGTTFLLVTHRASRLLPTIRSRCRIVHFEPAHDNAIKELLLTTHADLDQDDLSLAVRIAQGSPGRAQDIIRYGLCDSARIMESILEEGDKQSTLRTQLSKSIGARPDRKKLHLMLDIALTLISLNLNPISQFDLSNIDAYSKVYSALSSLQAELTTYNYDTGLVIAQISALLASVSHHRDQSYV